MTSDLVFGTDRSRQRPDREWVWQSNRGPDRTVRTIVHTMDGTYADLYIEPHGDITMIGACAPDTTY